MIACGGKCGRPDCRWTGRDENALNGHVGGVKALRSGVGWHKRSAGRTKAQAPIAETPASPTTVGTGFYPSFAAFKPPDDRAAAPPSPSAGVAAPSPAGPAAPAAFSSVRIWKGLAKLIDDFLPEDSRINLKEGEAIALDESLKQMGFFVEQRPGPPVIMPWWAPFAITFGGTFGLPIAIAVAPLVKDAVKKAVDSRFKGRGGRESGKEDTPAGVMGEAKSVGARPMAATETSAANPAPEEPPAEEPPMRVMAEVGPPGPKPMRLKAWQDEHGTDGSAKE